MSTATNRHGLRRYVAEPDLRRVRKECGFGCVICGEAFIHYEHILNFSDVEEHNPAEMALLCGKHHDQVTRKMLSKETVREARRMPRALQTGFSRYDGLDYRPGDDLMVQLGSATIRNPKSILSVDGEPLFTVSRPATDGGPLDINMTFYDVFGELVFEVRDNIYSVRSDVWDFTHEGQVVTIWNASRSIGARVRFCPRTTISVERLQMNVRGLAVDVNGSAGTVTLERLGGLCVEFGKIDITNMTSAFDIDSNGLSLGSGGGAMHIGSARTFRREPAAPRMLSAKFAFHGRPLSVSRWWP